MERILIDSKVKSYAEMYETAFRALGHDVPGDLRAKKADLGILNNTYNHLSDVELAQYQGYLEEVATDYNNINKIKNLLVLMPDEFDSYCKKYDTNYPLALMDKDLVYKVQIGGKNPGPKKKKFWELIVDTMHYEKDVRPLMIPFIEAMGIKSCVYCNVQYALTVDHTKGMFELDHRYPKSKYPFLCTTFYNLQPSCPTCNHGKRTATADFGLYTTAASQLKPFHLLTNPQVYFRKRRLDQKLISVHLISSDVNDPQMVSLAQKHQNDFNIDATYQELADVAEETMWRCKSYDDTYKDLFLKKFPELYDKDSLHRFIFGTYAEGNVHKRPLTKLIRDIEEDMRVVVTL
jgi:hypothetical protein